MEELEEHSIKNLSSNNLNSKNTHLFCKKKSVNWLQILSLNICVKEKFSAGQVLREKHLLLFPCQVPVSQGAAVTHHRVQRSSLGLGLSGQSYRGLSLK